MGWDTDRHRDRQSHVKNTITTNMYLSLSHHHSIATTTATGAHGRLTHQSSRMTSFLFFTSCQFRSFGIQFHFQFIFNLISTLTTRNGIFFQINHQPPSIHRQLHFDQILTSPLLLSSSIYVITRLPTSFFTYSNNILKFWILTGRGEASHFSSFFLFFSMLMIFLSCCHVILLPLIIIFYSKKNTEIVIKKISFFLLKTSWYVCCCCRFSELLNVTKKKKWRNDEEAPARRYLVHYDDDDGGGCFLPTRSHFRIIHRRHWEEEKMIPDSRAWEMLKLFFLSSSSSSCSFFDTTTHHPSYMAHKNRHLTNFRLKFSTHKKESFTFKILSWLL